MVDDLNCMDLGCCGRDLRPGMVALGRSMSGISGFSINVDQEL
jgi:hypothetical protein